jgi:hypothetical protein
MFIYHVHKVSGTVYLLLVHKVSVLYHVYLLAAHVLNIKVQFSFQGRKQISQHCNSTVRQTVILVPVSNIHGAHSKFTIAAISNIQGAHSKFTIAAKLYKLIFVLH